MDGTVRYRLLAARARQVPSRRSHRAEAKRKRREIKGGLAKHKLQNTTTSVSQQMPAREVASAEEAEPIINDEHGKSDLAAPQPPRFSLFVRAVRVIAYVSLYLFCGPALILINNKILRQHKFPYPMMLSGLGLIMTSLVCFVLAATGCVKLEHSELITRQFFFRNLLPVGASLATTFACGNAVYLYLPVGFIQMLKAFTPATTLAMLWLFAIETPSWRVLLSVVGICCGTAVASVGEGSLHPLGLLLMLGAEVSEAMRLVLTQKLLQNLRFGVIEGQLWLAPTSALWLFAASAVHELPKVLRTEAWRIPLANPLPFVASAVLGFLVSVCTFLVIKATNSVTLKVLGTARSAGLVVWSALFLGERITPLELGGYSLSLCAFAVYNVFKMQGR